MTEKRNYKIGMLGCGVVGESVYKLIQENKSQIAKRIPCDLSFEKILVKDLSKKRDVQSDLLTQDVNDIVNNDDIDIVIELIGDSPIAYQSMKQALQNKKPVVTANKAIIAKHGPELFEIARKNQTIILFEASVGAALPILRCLRESLNANQILNLKGIINGTSNYILSEMLENQMDFDVALKAAQDLGYAESDPSSDIEGDDARYKLSILIMLAYGVFIPTENIYCHGISKISLKDLKMAEKFNYKVKHLAITKYDQENNAIEARVHPAMISKKSPLASVDGAYNAVEYLGNYSGEGMIYGHGAGGKPTASAVVGDLIEVIYELSDNYVHPLTPTGFQLSLLKDTKAKDNGELQSAYYLRLMVTDEPCVLAQVAQILGEHKISIKHVYQESFQDSQNVPVIIFTHKALEANLMAALTKINQLDFITSKTVMIRIEE